MFTAIDFHFLGAILTFLGIALICCGLVGVALVAG